MLKRICLLVVLIAICIPARAEESVLSTLHKGHPRLMALDTDLARVREAIKSDPMARAWHEQVRKSADKMIEMPPIEHVLIGPRLLDKSRTLVTRVSTLAGLYRLDGDKKYAERAKKEMLTAAAFPDWNPKHFLDTAEMSNGMGIGYDWLFDYLSNEEKATIRKAIVELGLKEGLKVYEKGSWWAKATHNWNQVCNGGMTVGALAIATEEPELSAKIVDYARKSIPRAMGSFAPDGGWNEGPGYWGYADQYTTFFFAATTTALGTDFGLLKSPGYRDTGYFRINFISPIDKTFNYADAHEGAGDAYCMMWMAKALERPAYAAHERAHVRNATIFHLLWWNGEGQWPEKNTPLAGLWKGVDVALMRTSWTEKDAIWVGFKGGDNKANHSHLDLGTFNLDAFGQRWAEDLGSDNYNIPGYFGAQRWTYYRLRTEGHNTLTIDDENQEPKAAGPIVAFSAKPEKMFAVADLSAAFGKKLTSWKRGVGIIDQKRVVVIDEVQAASPVKVVWNFHTMAKVEVSADGKSATLSEGGKTMPLHIAAPGNAVFKAISAERKPPEATNAGATNLTIELGEKVTRAEIKVVMGAGPAGTETLAAWVKEGGK